MDIQRHHVLITIVAVLCLFFVLLYLRYKHVREQSECAKRDALIEEGDRRLQAEFFRADGTMNPAPFVFDEQAPLPPSDEDDGCATGTAGGRGANAGDGGKATAEAAAPGGGGGGGGGGSAKANVVSQVMNSIKSGKLLHTINRFATRTSQITERLSAHETPEEKRQREQWSRLADDAVNPLFARRAAKIQREREAHEKRKTDTAQRHAAAATLLGADTRSKARPDDDDDDNEDNEASMVTAPTGASAATQTPVAESGSGASAAPGTIYKFNDEQLQALGDVMQKT